MDQREFNRQMDAYLKERKSERTGVFSQLKSKLPRVTIVSDEQEEQEEPPTEVPKDQVEAVLRGERVREPSVGDEMADGVEEGVEESSFQGISLWERVVEFFAPTQREEDAFEDDVDVSEITGSQPRVDEDVKEMLRICVHWVNQLPPEKLQEVKRSDDFVEFKRLLDKYGLIKK